jgi:hypothetical protein
VVALLADATARMQQAAAELQKQTEAAMATSSSRTVLELRLAHMHLAVQRVMQLQSLKPARVAALLQRVLDKSAAAATAGNAGPGGAPGGAAAAAGTATAPAAVLEAVLGTQPGQGPLGSNSTALATEGSADPPAAAAAWTGWQHWSAATAAAACARGGAAWAKTVLGVQHEILQQVGQLGNAALAEHAASALAQGETTASSSSSGAAASSGSDAAASIREVLQQLLQVLDSVTRDVAAAEMAEVLQALHKAEFG